MLKYLFSVCVIALQCGNMSAHAVANSDTLNNPFSRLDFLNRPIEIFSLTTSQIIGYSQLDENNLSILQSIDRLYGLNTKKFHYSITFKLEGYPQEFNVPCCDKDLYHLLSAKANRLGRLKLKCVVYRFYTFDGTINFFYVEKATPASIHTD